MGTPEERSIIILQGEQNSPLCTTRIKCYDKAFHVCVIAALCCDHTTAVKEQLHIQ